MDGVSWWEAPTSRPRAASRAVVAFAGALGAGVATALIQCSSDEGMDGGGWNVGLLLLLVGTVVATLLAHRWWALSVALALAPPWISLVNCVSNDPTSDGMEVFYYPLEAAVTVVAVVVAFIAHRVLEPPAPAAVSRPWSALRASRRSVEYGPAPKGVPDPSSVTKQSEA
jgi:hypothetical protein